MAKKASKSKKKKTPPRANEKNVSRELNPMRLTGVQLARILNTTALGGNIASRQTVSNWVARGLPKNSDGSTFSLPTVTAWLARERQTAQEEMKTEIEKALGEANEHRERALKIKADLMDLDLEQKRGTLVNREETLQVWSMYMTRLRMLVQALAKSLCGKCQKSFTEEFNDGITDIADDISTGI